MELKDHPLASLFPLMDAESFAALKADIAEHGLRESVWLHEGKILDGRNRYRACVAAGVTPKTREFKGANPLAFVVSQNLHRRHLNESQRALIGAELKKSFEAEARARQAHGGTAPGRTLMANLPEASGTAREQAAAQVNVSPRSVETAAKVIANGTPELVQAVRDGGVRVSTAAVVADLPKREQKAVVAKGPEAVREKAAEIRGRSRVNGVETDDPPHIAKRRANGEIPHGVVVDVVEPEPEPEPHVNGEANGHPPDEPEAAELSDADWLDTLPLRKKLSGLPLKTFEEDALLYRRLEKARGTFGHHAARLLSKGRRKGPYHWRVKFFLKGDHPKHWVLCKAVDQGGCGGAGQVDFIGECVACKGAGYRINA